jgi:signal transduction histidine kinase
LAIEQIVDNLVSNALKYGPHRPVEVCLDNLDEKVRVRVRDYGPGISPKDRPRIFGRFERAIGLDESRSGFGIGLWVVGQLVDGMGGTITVDDALGGGSVFTVILPRNTESLRP